MTIEVLDPQETEVALRDRAVHNQMLNDLTDALVPIADTGSSVWAEGLNEPTINMLRTKLARKGLRLSTRKVRRLNIIGHILRSTTK